MLPALFAALSTIAELGSMYKRMDGHGPASTRKCISSGAVRDLKVSKALPSRHGLLALPL